MKWFTKSGAVILGLSLVLAGCGGQSGTQSGAQKGAQPSQNKQAEASDYPNKPITMIVPFTAGGSSDLAARAMEKVAGKHLGKPLVISNKPGGAATIGWNELAGSKPDGYTIGITNISITLQPIYGGTKYNYPEALEPIAQATTIPVLLAVAADSPWKTVEEFMKYAKEHPKEIKYGHSGLGTSTHVAAETIAQAAGVKIEQVPFQGGSQAITAMLGGHIQALFANPPEVQEHVKAGKLRILAIAEEQHSTDPLYKDVPTFKEKGMDVVLTIWLGVGGPKGLPDDVKKKLGEGFKNIMNDPEFVKSAKELGMDVAYLSPEEFGKKWVSESERYKKVVKDTGIADIIASQKK